MSKLTKEQEKARIKDLRTRLSGAITQVNDILEELAKNGNSVDIGVRKVDKSKIQTQRFPGSPNVKGLPKKIPGPKYKEVFIKFPKPQPSQKK